MTKQKKREIKTRHFQDINYIDSLYKLCAYCGSRLELNHSGNFCNNDCMEQYIDKQCKIRAGTWLSKHKQNKCRVFKLKDILNEENLKAMVSETKLNIDKKTKNQNRHY